MLNVGRVPQAIKTCNIYSQWNTQQAISNECPTQHTEITLIYKHAYP